MHLFGLSTQNKFAGRSSTATLFAGEKNMDLKGGGGMIIMHNTYSWNFVKASIRTF